MPIISLDLKANLVGVTNLRPLNTEHFRWFIKVKCTNCGEESTTWQYITYGEVMEVPGSRGEAHLVQKCKLCSRLNTLTIKPDSISAYDGEKNEQPQSLVKLDCRGVEPYDFEPRNGWICEGIESGTKFDDIDLSEMEWSDYDEKASEAVEINEISAEFNVVRGAK